MAEPAEGLILGEDGAARCFWCGSDRLYQHYHDTEWGRPLGDDRRIFEKICLEGFQAGLSWLTILRKREAFRRAFADFDIERVANFDARDVERLVGDAAIVRHRGKIESTINNAQRALELIAEAGSLAAFMWRFEPTPESRPERLDRAALAALVKTRESTALSDALRRRGWSFVGPTTIYAFMQSAGMVNDHIEGCHARGEVAAARRNFTPPVMPQGRTFRNSG